MWIYNLIIIYKEICFKKNRVRFKILPTENIHPGKNGSHKQKKHLQQDAQATEAIGDGTASIVLGVGGEFGENFATIFFKKKEGKKKNEGLLCSWTLEPSSLTSITKVWDSQQLSSGNSSQPEGWQQLKMLGNLATQIRWKNM